MTLPRTLSGRFVALTLALLLILLAGAGEASILHECAHHDGPGGHAAPQSHQGQHTLPSHPPSDEAPCTCIGTCHASAAAPVVVAGGPTVSASAPSQARATVPAEAFILPPLFRTYLHAYPNPPPARG